MKLQTVMPGALALVSLLSAGCSSKAPEAAEQSQEVAGPCQPAFGSPVCTWARMEGAELEALGATVPMASIEQTPTDPPMAWPPVAEAVIQIPAEARAATGVDHLTVYWEAHGHPPGPYLTPHFDFHFYVISDSARRAIDCADSAKPTELPSGYALPDVEIPGIGMLKGLCVPQMGMHALEAAALKDTTLFSGAMVVGYYAGKPIFFEPMISKAMLLEKKSFSLPLSVPTGLPAGIHFPTRFQADYDAALPGYRFVFSEFSK